MVVCIHGMELFDVLEDHLVQHGLEDFVVRFPVPGNDQRAAHELVFAETASLQAIQAAVNCLPESDRRAAEQADDAA